MTSWYIAVTFAYVALTAKEKKKNPLPINVAGVLSAVCVFCTDFRLLPPKQDDIKATG